MGAFEAEELGGALLPEVGKGLRILTYVIGSEVPAGCAGGNSIDVGVSRESLGLGTLGILGIGSLEPWPECTSEEMTERSRPGCQGEACIQL